MNLLKWLDENLEKFVLGVFLSIMVVVMGIQVVARYVFNSSLTWSEELTRFIFVWSAFLTLPYTIKFGISLKIDQLLNLFTKDIRKVLNIISHILMLVFFIFMLYNATDVVRSAINSGQRSPAIGLPMYLIQVSSVVGFALTIVRVLQSLVIYIRTTEKV
ncbi:TRAP transporter small permease [Schnuerera sp. xch1]|uniref:TRAP transporter small permease n=1 Tax=Schnuerera sp. xch1 TaxID=2874283 RepID=UPI001CBCE955|nr:TRAP transporter small permease [Schnuerera sp. xch1]MBZ2174909.1 TRAP transporter small permease [Schnuerera sp. xch1]